MWYHLKPPNNVTSHTVSLQYVSTWCEVVWKISPTCLYGILPSLLIILVMFISCDQAALWMAQSVRLSVTTFWLCSRHRIIVIFSGVINNERSDVHAKGQGQRSKIKATEVNTQLSRFLTEAPVWFHIWWWNGAQSLMLLRRSAVKFLKVIC